MSQPAMTDLKGARIVVAGAGAVGSAVAALLAAEGAAVLLADPAARGDNASGVAAGMLAPALEAALDGGDAERFQLLRQARDAWPDFAAALDLEPPIHRCGSLWVGEAGAGEARLARLRAIGAHAAPASAAQAAALSPGLVAEAALYSPEDWRLDPGPMLQALHGALLRLGGEITAAAVTRVSAGEVQLSDGRTWTSDWTVFAGGLPPPGVRAMIPELAALAPIKGQLLRYPAGTAPYDGPIVRSHSVYVAPSPSGPAVGATMEVGLDDRRVDASVIEGFAAAAAALFPALSGAPYQGQAGVRASTPDGLPLVGASTASGVLLATGARRNGWLLAPMIARRIAAAVQGAAALEAFDPGRFRAR